MGASSPTSSASSPSPSPILRGASSVSNSTASGSPNTSLPYNVVHNTHVSRDLEWSGSDPVDSIFELEKKLGSGACADVYLVKHRATGFKLAAKLVQQAGAPASAAPSLNEQESEDDERARQFAQLQQEIRVLKVCRNAHIVSYYGVAGPDSENRIWVLMDFCRYGSIWDMMESIRRQREIGQANNYYIHPDDIFYLSELQLSFIMYHTLLALAYLHSRHIQHYDVKGRNILVAESGRIKLADFGVSKITRVANGTLTLALTRTYANMKKPGTGTRQKQQQQQEEEDNVIGGSPYWLSPELIKGEPDTSKSDIWSLGITLIELAEMRLPHSNARSLEQLLQLVALSTSSPTLQHQRWSPLMRDFLAQALQMEVVRRPDAVKLLSHPWLTPALSNQGALKDLCEEYVNSTLPKKGS